MAVLELPRVRWLLRRALPRIVEAVLIPLVLFYVTFWTFGVWAAFVAALAWSYGVLAWRKATRRPVPAILALGSILLTGRTIIAVLSGSEIVYFLQPTLGTVLVGLAFLVSVPLGRPLAERLVRDFCPLPDALFERPDTRTAFARISLLWAAANLTTASVSLWLLLSQPVATYVVARQSVSLTVTGTAIALSVQLFVRSMRRDGVQVRFATSMP